MSRSRGPGGTHGTRLQFESEHYTHTLMTPFFNPGPIEHPDIPIFIGGVNPYMCRMAGEVADGLLMHSLNSVTYIREVVLPALERGLQKRGRTRRDFAAVHEVSQRHVAGRVKA